MAGLSIHRTDVAGLERVHRPAPGALSAFLRNLADELGASELVFLATCNRVEVIYAREEGEPPSPTDLSVLARSLTQNADDAAALAPMLRLRSGRAAMHHLFRVAGSLDSLVVGEDQILAQVREAYGHSADIGLVGPLLAPLFHSALQIGKKVRSDTELARHPVSVVTLAVARLSSWAASLPEGCRPALAVLGAGEMGALLARTLSEHDLRPALVANRSLPRAQCLASECGAVAVTLDGFRAGAVPVDALVSATSAPGLVLQPGELSTIAARAPAGRGLLAIDLAVPRDLPACDDPAVTVVGLDDLQLEADQNRALRAQAAVIAEQLVADKLERYAKRFHEERAAPAVTELREESAALLDRELSGLLGGRLSHLPEADRRAVERWARATFGRLMHLPVAALKRMAFERNGQAPDEHELED